ncbi:MAG: hypothetical protein P9L99_19950 [Candidatus Lernaella stagnicola]|nr:hypothetical protein [Candidatus Lernaella stagnicola]
MRKWLLPLIGVLFGAAGGYAYFHFFGCANGCPMKSSGPFMTIYGAVLGLFTLQTIGEIVTKVRTGKKLERAGDPKENNAQ